MSNRSASSDSDSAPSPVEPAGQPLRARALRTRRLVPAARLDDVGVAPGSPGAGDRIAMAFLTATTANAARGMGAPHVLAPIGLTDDGVAYFAETHGPSSSPAAADRGLPLLFRMTLRGPHAGLLVPMASWYAGSELPLLGERIAAISARCRPLEMGDPERVMLTTRVVQQRAEVAHAPRRPSGLELRAGARLAAGTLVPYARPYRKFVLRITADDLDATYRSATALVTAWLRPNVVVDGVWRADGPRGLLVRLRTLTMEGDTAHARHTVVWMAP